MAESSALVSFACQRCRQPLRLCPSLGALGEHALAELRLGERAVETETAETETESEADHYVRAFQLADAGNDFTLISDGETQPSEALSRRLRRDAALFDSLSANSDVDHPLCEECTDSLIELMDKQLKLAEAEWKDYAEYLRKIDGDHEDLDADALESELNDCRREERRLLDELDALRKEETEIENQISEREREKERLSDEQNVYLREITKYRKDLMNSEDRTKHYESRLTYAQSQLDKLNKTNVFKVAFEISDLGNFGIINNFRLGRLSKAGVDWSEINAAWGQTALLLSSLAKRIDFAFENYKPVPYGNHSYVESLADKKELPLYGSGSFSYLNTKFDAAMVEFLDCMRQFSEEVKRRDPEFKFPYKMERGKIEDPATGNAYSIKIQWNEEDRWTKALKFLLTNLKWGLTWVSSQFPDDRID